MKTFPVLQPNTPKLTDHFDKCLKAMNKSDATLKNQGRMDAFLTKASTSTPYKGKAEDFFNIEADTDKEDFDGADVTLAEK